MNSLVLIQARTTSSRLPGKALLPLHGFPMVVIAAKRAASHGHDILVATSSDPTDDVLAETLRDHEIPYARGSLDDPLERCVTALVSLPDETLVFRLTADNVFPDGRLLLEIERDFTARKLSYLCCSPSVSGMPLGVSVELTRLEYIRDAAATATDPFDLEHVTPAIKRRFGESYFTKYRHLNAGHLRCTIDCLDDYLSVHAVFSAFEDPIRASVPDLVGELSRAPMQPFVSRTTPKLVLGSAQLGTDYGICNLSGRPGASEAKKIIKTAIVNGAQRLDTARAYGGSEKVIGNVLAEGWDGRISIVTKLAPLADLSPAASADEVVANVDRSIYQSMSALRRQYLDVLLLHRASHLGRWNGEIWRRLKYYKEEGLIAKLGASVQSPAELTMVLNEPGIEHIQMPFNIIDHRWLSLLPHLAEARRIRGLTVDVRSVLLQGLLLTDQDDIWYSAGIGNCKEIIKWLDETMARYNLQNRLDLCLRYVRDQDWIDGIVLGVECEEQLRHNISSLCCGRAFSQSHLDEIDNTRPVVKESSLDPSTWTSSNHA